MSIMRRRAATMPSLKPAPWNLDQPPIPTEVGPVIRIAGGRAHIVARSGAKHNIHLHHTKHFPIKGLVDEQKGKMWLV